MTEIQNVIDKALVRYRGIQRKRAWLTAFGTAALVMALAALLDQQLMFSGLARWSGWIAGLVFSVWAARRAAGPACPDPTALAHQVESKAGETAPDFTLMTLDNESFNLMDEAKDMPLVIEFGSFT